jgi:DNA-directed RNA polymerase specialized sigma subunit
MIRTQAEYDLARKRLTEDVAVMAEQQKRLAELGLGQEEVARAMEPAQSFHAQLAEEVEAYERMRRGDLDPISDLQEIGRILIGLRIAQGLTQRQLAERLNVSESQVSRDERNDYHGITVERAQRIIDALRGSVKLQAVIEEEDGELVEA